MKRIQFLSRPIETRVERRGVVAVMYGSFALAVGLKGLINLTGEKWLLALSIPLIATCGLAFYAVHQLTADYAIQQNCAKYRRLTDERLAQIRDKAMARAYLFISLALMSAVLWMSMASDNGRWWKPTTYDQWTLIFWGVMLVTSTLPQSLILWQEPDEPRENENNLLAGGPATYQT